MQRMAVARALLRNAPVYILDEPTEGLDDRTAGMLLDALAQRLGGKTLLIISHRERDLALVDSVFRLETPPGAPTNLPFRRWNDTLSL
jgi:ATP-binding cassette subfamily C protein CydC